MALAATTCAGAMFWVWTTYPAAHDDARGIFMLAGMVLMFGVHQFSSWLGLSTHSSSSPDSGSDSGWWGTSSDCGGSSDGGSCGDGGGD